VTEVEVGRTRRKPFLELLMMPRVSDVIRADAI
jgi:hypothetical protein